MTAALPQVVGVGKSQSPAVVRQKENDTPLSNPSQIVSFNVKIM